jgi:chemotaxis protein methyltransferase CheR
LNDAVRGMVKFAHIDLRRSLSTLGPFDVVLCRNVLIYFDVESRKRILREIHGAISSGGYLLLGGSETTLNLDASFVQQTIGTAVLHRAP